MSNNSLKLYAWQPKGHGEYSFFVMDISLDDAKQYVEKEIEKLDSYEYCGWGTDYYNLTVANVGDVITNAND